MAKRQVAKRSQESKREELEERMITTCEELVMARKIAARLFGPTPSAEMVFDVHDRMVQDAENETEAAVDLDRAVAMAKEIFEIEPTSEMVFGVFDTVFESDDDNED